MSRLKFEYIWRDGHKPEANFRSKTKVLEIENFDGDHTRLPMWSFDGSSTEQAEGGNSDCLLKPVRAYIDPQRKDGWLVMCEVLSPDGTPHPSNTRAMIEDQSDDYWFGFEQEYVLTQDDRPIGFPSRGFPAPQGPYYCAVGTDRVKGRNIVEEHMDACIGAGIGLTGVNAEVMLGQWEFQVFGKGALRASDDLMVARYLLHRITEKHEMIVNIHPKPVKGDWNGSGMHVNFSNGEMRDVGGKEYFRSICEAFRPLHNEHIAIYGSDNDQRLTGLHETQAIDKFSYGVSDRGASIRIPINTAENWKGYLEDRRPASNADPYLIAQRIIKTVESAQLETA